MKRNLFVLLNNVWDADDYLNGNNCNPKCTDMYLFDSEDELKDFAMKLDANRDIYNDCYMVNGEVDEETILELSGCECMEDFNEILATPYSEQYGWREKEEVAKYILDEFNSTMKDVEAANYDFDKSIEGAIIVVWSWERYIGYARKCKEVRYAQYGEKEDMLTKADKVFVPQCDIVMTKEEVESCGDIRAELEERLLTDSWKWTNPGVVKSFIGDF